jgi:hypothetical protein
MLWLLRRDMQGRVKVAVRCRPPFQDELSGDAAGRIVVNIEEGRGADRIFLSGSSQVWSGPRPLSAPLAWWCRVW